MKTEELRIVLSSASDYEKLTADIKLGDNLICTMNQDHGLTDPILDFYPIAMRSEKFSVSVSSLFEAIEEAKGYLADRQRTP